VDHLRRLFVISPSVTHATLQAHVEALAAELGLSACSGYLTNLSDEQLMQATMAAALELPHDDLLSPTA
jgi:hypothetical protein